MAMITAALPKAIASTIKNVLSGSATFLDWFAEAIANSRKAAAAMRLAPRPDCDECPEETVPMLQVGLP